MLIDINVMCSLRRLIDEFLCVAQAQTWIQTHTAWNVKPQGEGDSPSEGLSRMHKRAQAFFYLFKNVSLPTNHVLMNLSSLFLHITYTLVQNDTN